MKPKDHELFTGCKPVDMPYSDWLVGWTSLRKEIKHTERYSYCFWCHLPQMNRPNGGTYLPPMHGKISKENKDCGGLGDLIVPIIWYIFNNEEVMYQAYCRFKDQGLRIKE